VITRPARQRRPRPSRHTDPSTSDRENTIHIQPKPATVKNPAEQFTGDVWFDVIASPQQQDQRMVVGLVRFAPGARTAWHSHANGQTLHVTHGIARMQARGGDVIDVHPGQTVYTPPGEEHWHGATPDDFMEHLAMFENSGDASITTTWGQHVTDDEYNTTPGRLTSDRNIDDRST
jgi:quercetin dioxygenase-like cupin family protein